MSTYICKCSSAVINSVAGAFDYNFANAYDSGLWYSTYANQNYNASNGSYSGTQNLVSGYNGKWCSIELPTAITLTRYVIVGWASAITRGPQRWKLYGSNNGTSWGIIDTISYPTGVNFSYNSAGNYSYDTSGRGSFTDPPSVAYKIYGLVVSGIGDNVGVDNGLNFQELKIFGTETTASSAAIVPLSGGSGGGGGLNQAWNATYSKMNAGSAGGASVAGNGGGSAFSSAITGTNYVYGSGGSQLLKIMEMVEIIMMG